MMTQISKNNPVQQTSCPHDCCPEIRALLDARLFKAIGEPSRQALLSCLSRCCRPCSVSEIATCCDIDFSVVSRHLVQLEQAGVLTAQKSGRTVRYQLRFSELASRLRALADALEACERFCHDTTPCTGVCCAPDGE